MKKLFTLLVLSCAIFAVSAQNCAIQMEAHDVWGDGTGYQILLDGTHAAFASLPSQFTCNGTDEYALYNYKVPTNATADDDNVVVDGIQTILIPAGTYDYVIVNPGCTGYGTIYIASEQCDATKGDDVTFEANKTYNFSVAMSGSYDCTTLTVTDGLAGVGIANNATANVTIYPNPASTVLNVNAEGFNKVEITNLLGQVVMADAISSQAQLNVSNLNEGIYFVRLSGDNGTYTQKFIKK